MDEAVTLAATDHVGFEAILPRLNDDQLFELEHRLKKRRLDFGTLFDDRDRAVRNNIEDAFRRVELARILRR